MTASARARIGPRNAFMLRSSLIRRPSKPISPRMILARHDFDVLAGRSASMAEKTTCAVIAAGRCANALNVAKSVAESSSREP